MSKGTVIARGGLNLRQQPGAGRVLKALRRDLNRAATRIRSGL